MHHLLKKCVGKKHAAILTYFSGKGKPLTYIECAITEVNKTTFSYNHSRTHKPGSKGPHIYTELGHGKRTDHYVRSDGYLVKVSIDFGVEHNVSPIDDGNDGSEDKLLH